MATFGKTSAGASQQAYTTNRKLVSKVTLVEDALLTSLTARLRRSNTTQARVWKGVIYSDAAGVPDALLYTTDEGSVALTTVSSLTQNFAGQSLPAGTYWIGVIVDSNATTNVAVYRDNTAGDNVSNNDTYSDGPANPFGATAANNGPFDVYVTYTPDTGGGARVKVKSGGTFVTKPVNVKVGGTFVAKDPKVKVGGVFV